MSITKILEYWNDSSKEPKQRLPENIQFPINNICNSSCQMCDIWKQKKGNEITPDEVRKILKNPLYANVKGVGINGGEPTLRNEIGAITEAIVETLPQLRSISLITNAILFRKVSNGINAIGEACKKDNKEIKFDVMVSLDGLQEVHDRVRGKPGNFDSAVKTLEFVQENPLVDSYRIGCTIIKENVYHIEDLLFWLLEKNIYGRFRLGVPHKRLYSRDKRDAFDLNDDEKYHLANFLDYLRKNYETDTLRQDFLLSLRNQIIYGYNREHGCAWRNRGVTLSSQGELAYCAVESNYIGNPLKEDSIKLYHDNEEHLKEIRKNKCDNCTHDYMGIGNRKALAKVLFKKLSNKNKLSKKLVTETQKAVTKSRKLKKILKVKGRKASSSSNNSKRALIIGWYGTETLGDKAILGGLIESLKNVDSQIEIDVASIERYITEQTQKQMTDTAIQKVIDLNKAKSNAREGHYKAIIFGGGPLMSSVDQIINMLEIASLAKSKGANFIIAGCGIGPINKNEKINNVAIKQILDLADLILLRDEKSKKVAKDFFKLRSEPEIILDPSFIWLNQKRKTLAANTTPKKQILLALRDWPVEQYGFRLKKRDAIRVKENFQREVIALINTLKENFPEHLLIPFCMNKITIGGDDRAFYRSNFAHCPEFLQNLDNRHQTPENDFKLFLESDLIIAMRFHGSVFGFASSRPTFGIDYTGGGKIESLYEQFQLSKQRIELENFDSKLMLQLIKDNKNGLLTETLEDAINDSRNKLESKLSLFINN